MKALLLLSLVYLSSLSCFAQIKTDNSSENVSISGLKFGYVYTVAQIKDALGEPSRTRSSPNDDYGAVHELTYGSDLVLRFDSDKRTNKGLHTILILSSKYALTRDGITITVGSPVSELKKIPGYTGMVQSSEDWYTVIFNNLVTNECYRVKVSKENNISMIDFSERFY